MRRKGMKTALVLSAALVSVSLAACASSSDNGAMTEGNSTAQTGESVTPGASGEEATESNESVERPSEDETKETDPTNPVEPDRPQDLSDTTVNAFKMLHMSIDEAREYYGVEEDSDKTAEDFDAFVQMIFEESITVDRLTLDQYLQDAKGYGIDYLDEITYDPGSLLYADGEIEEIIDVNTEEIKELLSYPYEKLSARQQLVFDKMYYQYQMSFWSFDVPDYSSYVGITSGLISNLAITFYEYVFDTEENVDTYQKVMEYVPGLILEVPEHIRYQIDELGYAPTDYMLETAMESIEGLLVMEENPFIDGFNEKIDALGLDKDTASAYKKQNQVFYEEEVIPALEQAYDELEELLGTNPEGQGLYYYDGGLEYYEYLVESVVGSDKSIDELMTILEDRIASDYSALIRRALLNSSAIEDYYDGNVEYPVDEDAQAIVRYFIDEMSSDFPDLGDVSYQVSYLPSSLEVDGIIAYYLIPRLDSTATNVMRVNGSSTEGDMTTLFMTLAHEGYPGHMLQFNVQQSCGAYDVEQLLSYLGYSEGWAMYAEHRCMEYAELSKAMVDIILLDSDISYNIYAYIDLGVNGKGWGVDEIYDYLDGFGMGDAAPLYYDAVIGDPGAIIPYSLGYIFTEEAIEEYVEETGVPYREAYESFMSIGAAPFSLVEKYMGTEF